MSAPIFIDAQTARNLVVVLEDNLGGYPTDAVFPYYFTDPVTAVYIECYGDQSALLGMLDGRAEAVVGVTVPPDAIEPLIGGLRKAAHAVSTVGGTAELKVGGVSFLIGLPPSKETWVSEEKMQAWIAQLSPEYRGEQEIPLW